jgi:hypothetical protein
MIERSVHTASGAELFCINANAIAGVVVSILAFVDAPAFALVFVDALAFALVFVDALASAPVYNAAAAVVVAADIAVVVAPVDIAAFVVVPVYNAAAAAAGIAVVVVFPRILASHLRTLHSDFSHSLDDRVSRFSAWERLQSASAQELQSISLSSPESEPF